MQSKTLILLYAACLPRSQQTTKHKCSPSASERPNQGRRASARDLDGRPVDESPCEQVDPLEQPGRHAWTLSTGRNKTFSINANALNIDLAVDAICQYAFILTRVRETATIMKAKLMVHMGETVDRFDTDQCISRARDATKDFVLPGGGYTREKSVRETSGSSTAETKAASQAANAGASAIRVRQG
jgi:hypothetical protein